MAQVLVVDDDPAMAGLIEFHLRRGGHRVTVVGTRAEARAAVATEPTQEVVVLEVALTGMTGFELLDDLRAVAGKSALGAVFLSPRNRPRDIELGIHMGAAYLTKPLVAADLLAAVARSTRHGDGTAHMGEIAPPANVPTAAELAGADLTPAE